jgi:multidrug efflux system outer membrane protein
MRPASAAAFSLLLTACAVGPDYTRPKLATPQAFKSAATEVTTQDIPKEWWRLYRDPQLDELMARADRSNQSLRRAVAHVDEARALAHVAAADFYPTLALSPSVGVQRSSANRPSPTTGSRVGKGVTVSDFVLPLDLSYEADVWGRVRRSVESAHAQAAASIDDEGVVRLSIQADVAQYYYMLRFLDSQLEVLARTLDSYQEQVRLLSVQVRTGIASPISLTQAQAQLQSTLAQQQDVGRARTDEEHALAILCGSPAPLFGLATNPLRDTPVPSVPAGMPATVLSHRPDVAEAEHNLMASNAEIGVAKAELYPRLTLTGAAGFESASIGSLFDWQSRLASLLAGITAPLFEGGRLSANLQAAGARYREALATYINQVLVAYADVEDALTDLHASTNQVDDLSQAVRASEDYRRLAGVQYQNGLVDYLTVIDAERTLLSNELALAQATNLQMAASIRLIKALGGGWKAES